MNIVISANPGPRDVTRSSAARSGLGFQATPSAQPLKISATGRTSVILPSRVRDVGLVFNVTIRDFSSRDFAPGDFA